MTASLRDRSRQPAHNTPQVPPPAPVPVPVLPPAERVRLRLGVLEEMSLLGAGREELLATAQARWAVSRRTAQAYLKAVEERLRRQAESAQLLAELQRSQLQRDKLAGVVLRAVESPDGCLPEPAVLQGLAAVVTAVRGLLDSRDRCAGEIDRLVQERLAQARALAGEAAGAAEESREQKSREQKSREQELREQELREEELREEEALVAAERADEESAAAEAPKQSVVPQPRMRRAAQERSREDGLERQEGWPAADRLGAPPLPPARRAAKTRGDASAWPDQDFRPQEAPCADSARACAGCAEDEEGDPMASPAAAGNPI
jgi:hypothetical protein